MCTDRAIVPSNSCRCCPGVVSARDTAGNTKVSNAKINGVRIEAGFNSPITAPIVHTKLKESASDSETVIRVNIWFSHLYLISEVSEILAFQQPSRSNGVEALILPNSSWLVLSYDNVSVDVVIRYLSESFKIVSTPP